MHVPTPALPETLDLNTSKRLHVVGCGGPGMSAIAIVLAEMGHQVSGSDVRETAVLRQVRESGVEVFIGHDPQRVLECDAVTASTAIPADNPEVVSAQANGVPMLRRAAMLAAICGHARTLAVAGTHGKTTTSSLLRAMLAGGGHDPSFIIGGNVIDQGTGARWTGSPWLVVEADESDGTHLTLPLKGTVLTNIDKDHLDYYGTFDELVQAFADYVRGIGGPVALCVDDPNTAAVARECAGSQLIRYGSGVDVDVRYGDVHAQGGITEFTVTADSFGSRRVAIPLRGLHNVANATGALALATACGVDVDAAIASVREFGGVGRRFDVIGSDDGATFVDDYAHLPREIAAVLAAARSGGDHKRIIAVFQPNRFNRMAIMSPEYADAFVDADLTVITEIYSSGTEPIPGVTGELVVDAIRANHPDAPIEWIPDRGDLVDFLAREAGDGDMCISMGCGDVEFLPREILRARAGS